jgi:hypothetical protein
MLTTPRYPWVVYCQGQLPFLCHTWAYDIPALRREGCFEQHHANPLEIIG